MPIANTISDVWCRFQEELFPALTEIPGPLSDRHRKLAAVLEFATPEALRSGRKQARGQAPGRSRRPCEIVHREGGLEHADHAGSA